MFHYRYKIAIIMCNYCNFDLLYFVVPTPNVTVTTPNTQAVGGPLTLTCNVTAVRGINSSVDVSWSSDGTELQMTEGVSVSSTTDNSVVYTNTYTISQLNTADDGREYQCDVVINSTLPVMADDSVTLDVMGECVYVTCLSSYYPTECVPLNHRY